MVKRSEMTQEQKRAQNRSNAASRERYNAATYEKMTFRVKQDGSDGFTLVDVRQAAEHSGGSVNTFVIEAIREKIERG